MARFRHNRNRPALGGGSESPCVGGCALDPLLWTGRSGQVTEAYGLLPDPMKKRVQFDSIAAATNRSEIMKKAKDAKLQLKPKKPSP